jgi:transcriptional regulator with XRE-family HTH domain
MRSISQCFGENVRRLRLERDYTQEEFAKETGLSISFLQNIEYGKKWATPKTIRLLANTLRVSESELFRDCSQPSHPEPKEILLMIGRAFGILITEDLVTSLKTRVPPYRYTPLLNNMPPEITHELMERCQQKDWDWEEFRKRLSE